MSIERTGPSKTELSPGFTVIAKTSSKTPKPADREQPTKPTSKVGQQAIKKGQKNAEAGKPSLRSKVFKRFSSIRHDLAKTVVKVKLAYIKKFSLEKNPKMFAKLMADKNFTKEEIADFLETQPRELLGTIAETCPDKVKLGSVVQELMQRECNEFTKSIEEEFEKLKELGITRDQASQLANLAGGEQTKELEKLGIKDTAAAKQELGSIANTLASFLRTDTVTTKLFSEFGKQVMLPAGIEKMLGQEAADLEEFSQEIVDTVIKAAGKDTPGVKKFNETVKTVHDTFASLGFGGAGRNEVSALYFLRTVNPAIIRSSSKQNRKSKILGTKILQNFANNVAFGSKEKRMEQYNPLLEKLADKRKALVTAALDNT